MVLSKNANITDFFVEANIDGGTHKGIFRSDTQSNWHRKHKQHHSNYFNEHLQSKENFLNRKTFASQFTGSSAIGTTRDESTKLTQANNRVRVDESGISIANNNDEQAFNSSSSGSNNYVPTALTSSMRKAKRFKATNHVADHCAQEYWSETIVSGSRVIQFTKHWSYTKTDLLNKTVSFRWVAHLKWALDFLLFHFNFHLLSSLHYSIFRILFRKKFSFDVFELTATFSLKNGKPIGGMGVCLFRCCCCCWNYSRVKN